PGEIDVVKLGLRQPAFEELDPLQLFVLELSAVAHAAPSLKWSAITRATQAESFLPAGICRNSLGPCAFECGPRTPVIRNWACGNRSPSMLINGIVPPRPMNAGGLPKKLREASSSDRASQGANSGAFQPAAPQSGLKVTFAP